MINVKLKTRENIDVQLQPKQGIKIDSSNKYLFDPTLIQGYVDLTKDYSDKAMQSEANAKASEMNAELSAEQAKASEDNAKLSETRAKESELNAKTSENNAKESETNAKTSETNAKNSEVKATQEANASAESAYQSQQSALASAEYASNAQSDSENASETLTHVLESEEKTREYSETAKENSEIAVAKANESKQSEINAKASENKAIQEANASAESAYNSQQSALASYEYSQNAESDAQNASETLGLVLEVETRVTQSEQRIKEYSDNASAKSEIATEKAEIATTKASESLASANRAEQSAKNSSDSASVSLEYSTSAGQSASSASLSASNASKSESNAKASETNSKSSETNAKASETSASQSATSASNSAKTAKEKADEASQFALECADIKSSLQNIYVFKGSVPNVASLPTNASIGDVYDVRDSGVNYAWTGTEWDALGVSVDLSLYATKEYVNTTEQEIIENYMEADTALQTQITGLSSALDTAQDNIVSINGKISDSASSTNKLIANSELFNATQSVRSDFADADAELQIQINGQATVIASKQDKLVSGTNIKTVNGESVLGRGNILIKSAPDLDNKTITQNASSQLQTIGVVNQNSSEALKLWTGTKAQYDNITKDTNTLYNVTDDESSAIKKLNELIEQIPNQVNEAITNAQNQVTNTLNKIYPIGSIYLTINSENPATLLGFGTWTQVSSGRVLQGADSSHTAGSTIEAGLPNITGSTTGWYLKGDRKTITDSGAITTSRNDANYAGTSSQTATNFSGLNFNASRSNSIYGKSSTVQPPAFVVNIWQRTA